MPEFRVNDYRTGSRLFYNEFQTRPAQIRVDRHPNRSQFGQSKKSEYVIRVVGHNNRHPLTGRHPMRRQSICQSVYAAVQFPEGDILISINTENIVGRLPDTDLQQLTY